MTLAVLGWPGLAGFGGCQTVRVVFVQASRYGRHR
jgi:hypothetical protein